MKLAPSCQSSAIRQALATILLTLFMLSLCGISASAQNTISTIAGGGKVSGTATGPMADIAAPSSVTKDPQGNVYVSGPAQNQIYKIDTSGNISIFAGTGYPSEDPQKLNGYPATQGTLNSPTGIASDKAGNIIIADTTDYLIRKVAVGTNKISVVAGNAHQCADPTQTPYACGDNGAPYSATLGAPTAVATDKQGNVYIADTNDNRIRVVNVTMAPIVVAGTTILKGTINSIAGTGYRCSPSTAPCGDGGPGLSASFNGPNGIALDSQGNIYVADTGDRRIRVINNSTGIVTTYAGTGNSCIPSQGCGDNGPPTSANISSPWQISFDPSGNLYISDPPESKIREVQANGNIITFAGSGTRNFSGDGGAATSAAINSIRGVWADTTGNVYIADTGNQRVRVVNSGNINTLAGGGNGGDGGPAVGAILAGDRATAIDSNGNIYIADTANNRVREFTVGGNITTLAGTGIAAYSGDGGPASAATLSGPEGVAVDNSNNVYIADSNNFVIRMVNTSGVISTVAGNGKSCAPSCGDGGLATSASFMFPTTVEPDAFGNFYVADQRANQIRMVNSSGIISTFAGTGTACTNTAIGACGDGQSATGPNTELSGPFSAAPDLFGNVYIADTNDNRIRVVNGGIINAFAFTGNGILYGPNKAPALQFAYNTPQDVIVDAGGNVYVAGSGLYYTIERIDIKASGNPVVAVTGRVGDPKYYGYAGDGGLALQAQLDNYGASIDANGDLYIADGTNNAVRAVTLTPSATIAPSSLVFPATLINTTSAPLSFKLTNNGSNDLIISSITVTGEFALTTGTPCANNQVPPGFSCTISVTFTPTTYGTITGKVVINDNAYQDPTQTVYLTGYGPDYTITAVPNSLTVAPGNQGTSTITLTPSAGFNQTVSLTCTGMPKQSTCNIVPNSITLDGTDAASATLTVSTSASTPPGSYTLKANGKSVTNHAASIALTVS